MGRSITFNLLEGTGTVQAPAHGWLSIRPTKEHITGSMVVLATEDERRINSQGVVTFPDVQPTPEEDPNTGKYPWAYIVKYRNSTGYETSWTVLVPVGTTPLQGSQLIQVVPDDVHYTIMQGPAGEKGDGIHVYGAYPTVSAMEAANPLPKRGDSYLIGSKLYVWDGATWGNSSDLQGAKGDKGDKGIQGQQGTTGLKGDTGLTGATPAITAVANTGEPGSATAVVKGGTDVAPVLTFTIPRGDKGETGAQGLKGDKGDTGDQGAPGQGVPTADGSNGAVITYSDGQTLWVDPNTLIPDASTTTKGLMAIQDKLKVDASATSAQLAAASTTQKNYTDTLVGGQVATMVTKDQLPMQLTIPCGWNGATPLLELTGPQNHTIFTAPFPMEILSLTLIHDRATIPNTAGAKVGVGWRKLANDSAATASTVAWKYTTDEAWTTRRPWNFDGVPQTAAARKLAAGESLNLAFSPVTGATYYMPIYVTIKWRPL